MGLPPYSRQEIDRFEQSQQVELPPALKSYLLEVSRETTTRYGSTILELYMEDRDECVIPDDKDFWGNTCKVHSFSPYESCDCEYWSTHQDTPNWIDQTAGMLLIAGRGVDLATYVVVRGRRLGTVWTLDGDYVHLECTDIKEYLRKPTVFGRIFSTELQHE